MQSLTRQGDLQVLRDLVPIRDIDEPFDRAILAGVGRRAIPKSRQYAPLCLTEH